MYSQQTERPSRFQVSTRGGGRSRRPSTSGHVVVKSSTNRTIIADRPARDSGLGGPIRNRISSSVRHNPMGSRPQVRRTLGGRGGLRSTSATGSSPKKLVVKQGQTTVRRTRGGRGGRGGYSGRSTAAEADSAATWGHDKFYSQHDDRVDNTYNVDLEEDGIVEDFPPRLTTKPYAPLKSALKGGRQQASAVLRNRRQLQQRARAQMVEEEEIEDEDYIEVQDTRPSYTTTTTYSAPPPRRHNPQRQPATRATQPTEAMFKRPTFGSSSAFQSQPQQESAFAPVEEFGGGAISTGLEAKITIKNLGKDLTEEDIHAVCSQFGENEVTIQTDYSGQSVGVADVVFAQRSHAVKAQKKLNEAEFDEDGNILQVSLTQVGPRDRARAAFARAGDDMMN